MPTQSATSPDPALVAFMEDFLRTALQEHFTEQLQAFALQNEQRSKEYSLMERMVRVEEELKALRETEGVHFAAVQKEMAIRFEAMNERFEAMNERFEAMNERITSFQKENATRFEAMDKRFTQLMWTILVGFTMLGSLIGWMGYLAR